MARIALVLALVASAAGPAAAVTREEVETARERVAQLRRAVERRQSALASLERRAAELAVQMSAAQGELERIRGSVQETRRDLDRARAEYERLRARLDRRAHRAYMEGPGTELEFLLGATSLVDLSDRLEFLNAVTGTDADLAARVQNLEYRLSVRERRLAALAAQQARVIEGLRAERRELDSLLARQETLLEAATRKETEARRLAERLGQEYREQAAAVPPGAVGGGPLEVCPVGTPRAFGDDFGAPRYSGGYHPHAGNDIFAPMGTPIYAPFDGVAVAASNGLGGLSVIVRGREGYVYNAHLSRFGRLGPVSAGDVIGYVGNSGNASGTAPHDHFEWHPNVIPSSWPASAYGYSVVGHAINPRPLLLAVC